MIYYLKILFRFHTYVQVSLKQISCDRLLVSLWVAHRYHHSIFLSTYIHTISTKIFLPTKFYIISDTVTVFLHHDCNVNCTMEICARTFLNKSIDPQVFVGVINLISTAYQINLFERCSRQYLCHTGQYYLSRI